MEVVHNFDVSATRIWAKRDSSLGSSGRLGSCSVSVVITMDSVTVEN